MARPLPLTHYEILRVDRRATPQRVKTSYRRLAQQFHPDKQSGLRDTRAVMARINEAYAVLSDPVQRAAYDDWLTANGMPPPPQPGQRPPAGAPQFSHDAIGWSNWLLLLIACAALVVLAVLTLRPAH